MRSVKSHQEVWLLLPSFPTPEKNENRSRLPPGGEGWGSPHVRQEEVSSCALQIFLFLPSVPTQNTCWASQVPPLTTPLGVPPSAAWGPALPVTSHREMPQHYDLFLLLWFGGYSSFPKPWWGPLGQVGLCLVAGNTPMSVRLLFDLT